MNEQAPFSQEALQEAVFRAEARCRTVLDSGEISLPGMTRPPTAPACYELLRAFPSDGESAAVLDRLAVDAERFGVNDRSAVERYVVLQACLIALPQLMARGLDGEIIRRFCAMVGELASNKEDGRLDRKGDAFAELARIVTFRRFHAGQLSFDIARPRAGVVLWWLLRSHPLDLPRLVRVLVRDIGLLRPTVEPHLCYWREKPGYILRNEQERSLARIARAVERDCRVGGLIAWSWLYGAEVGRVFPHLAWIRASFGAAGARIVDLGPASPDSGFLVGSRKRRELFADGTFRPREALVLWPRAELLAWARDQRQPDDAARQALPPAARLCAERKLRSGRRTLIDCGAFLFKRPKTYGALLLVAPALAAAIVGWVFRSAGAGAASFAAVFVLLWLFQYFFLQ